MCWPSVGGGVIDARPAFRKAERGERHGKFAGNILRAGMFVPDAARVEMRIAQRLASVRTRAAGTWRDLKKFLPFVGGAG